MSAAVSMSFFLAAWLLARFVNGLAGMGAAMVALPLVAVFIALSELVPGTCIVITFLTAYMARACWQDFHPGDIAPLLVGCVPGTLYRVSAVALPVPHHPAAAHRSVHADLCALAIAPQTEGDTSGTWSVGFLAGSGIHEYGHFLRQSAHCHVWVPGYSVWVMV